MRILITTGIFEPETGGPATYTPKIATKLREAGHDVTVVAYSDKEQYDSDSTYPFKVIRVVRDTNKFSNYFRFFLRVFRELKQKDIAYSLDWVAAGFPLVIAARIRNVPVVMRVGGDYIWETYLRTHLSPMPLNEFYEKGLYKNFHLLFRVITFVLRRSFVVFNSAAQREMYFRFYGLKAENTAVIYNAMPEKEWLSVKRESPNNEIAFAGRLIAMKNIESLLEAFAKAHIPYRLVLIGNGPDEHRVRKAIQELRIADRVTVVPAMSQRELYERVKNSRALILPSWTDIAPNEVHEALTLGIPILVTKENHLPFRDQLPETLDPTSIDDIRAKLEMLADEKRYREFVGALQNVSFTWSWDDVLKRHLEIFERVVPKR